jgi:S-layer protein (TIGR01567 family)
VTSIYSGELKVSHRIYRLSMPLPRINQMSTIALGRLLLLLGLVCLFVSLPGCSQSVESAWVRGQISNQSGVWHAADFGWFYYDLDAGMGGEELSVEVDGRLADKGHIVYSSSVWNSKFKHKPWGSYRAIALLGKRYLAGYPESSFSTDISSLDRGELREVLIDDDWPQTISSNSTLGLLQGYSLALGGVSESDHVVSLILLKDKRPVYAAAVSVNDTFAYKVQDLPVILAHVSMAMRSQEDVVELDGIFQASDIPGVRLEVGGREGNMELSDLTEDRIEFKSDKALSLTRNSVVPLLGTLELAVIDQPELLYYPQGGVFDYGVQDLRGPVFTGNSTLPLVNPQTGEVVDLARARWNYENFTGFYFDPEKSLGLETMIIQKINGRGIDPADLIVQDGYFRGVTGGLQYTAFVQPKQFEFRPWGVYYLLSFFGQLWFAGYGPETSRDIGSAAMLSQYRIGQMLIDSDETVVLRNMSTLSLGEGYTFALLSVSQDKGFFHLLKDGRLVESVVLNSNSTYRYKREVGEVKDLPVLALHVQSVFDDGVNQTAVIDGIFQISDQNYLPVDWGRKFDKLEIFPTPAGIVFMANTERINLAKDSSVSLWPGIGLRVADNDTLRYYLYSQQYVVPKPKVLGVDSPKSLPAGGRTNLSMLVQAGEIEQVSAEILDPSGRTIYLKDLTPSGVGAEDLWRFSWSWNATTLEMSDDGALLVDTDQGPVPAILYLNETLPPLQVQVKFDPTGMIEAISDGRSYYYLAPAEYNLTSQIQTYQQMLENATARESFVRIVPNITQLKLFEIINGTSQPSSFNHTLAGAMERLEPHAARIPAAPGRYELRIRVQNAADALRVTGLYLNVTGPVVQGVALGGATVLQGEKVAIPLRVQESLSAKRLTISYDPTVVKSLGTRGNCRETSSVDEARGIIIVVLPPECNSTELLFTGLRGNATADLKVLKVEGVEVSKAVNATISVLPGTAPKSGAAGCEAAILALVLSLFFRQGRRAS